jgi:hypothetical protein
VAIVFKVKYADTNESLFINHGFPTGKALKRPEARQLYHSYVRVITILLQKTPFVFIITDVDSQT